jgi:cobalt/nickel transport system ATP-binding protein
MNSVPAIEIRDLRYSYPDGSVALDGLSLSVTEGERVALVGANGAGKSTLLLHLIGILRGKGAVRIFGASVEKANLTAIRSRVGLVFQNPDDQLFCPTLFDDVAFGPRNLKLPEDDVKRRVESALEAVGLVHKAQKNAYHLSLGEKKRAALATVLSMDTRILALDEPTSNLDPRGRRRLLALLEKIGGTQIVATHDIGLARDLCNRAVLLYRGRCVADTTPEALLTNAELLESNGL